MKNELAELIDFLEQVADDESERYVLTVEDSNGTRKEIVGRQEYLQFAVESATQSLCGIQEELYPELN